LDSRTFDYGCHVCPPAGVHANAQGRRDRRAIDLQEEAVPVCCGRKAVPVAVESGQRRNRVVSGPVAEGDSFGRLAGDVNRAGESGGSTS
jgi:hypothetical protein